MNAPHNSWGAWRFVLVAYPPSIRRDFGSEIIATVAAAWHEQRGVRARIRLVLDLVRDGIASWRGSARSPRSRQEIPLPERPGRPWSGLGTDVRSAGRIFSHAPLFAVGAVVTLALGIGATSAIFSLADATLLRPVAIRDPGRVWRLDDALSNPDFRDLENAPTPFAQVAAWSDQKFGLDRNGESVEVIGDVVSGGYFALTGVQPLAGRLLNSTDDRTDATAVAVVTERAWSRLMGRDPTVVGSTIQLNRRPVLVVGIVPRSFRGLSLQNAPDVFITIHAMSQVGTGLLGRERALSNRGLVWLQIAGRLPEGANPVAAASAVAELLQRVHPPEPGEHPDPITMGPLTDRALAAEGTSDPRVFMYILLGATSVTLLLACATVANLLLVRAERRRREMALRSALGAGRGRLMRLVFIESLTLGIAGCLGALFVARAALQLLGAFELPGRVSIADLALTLSPTLVGVSMGLGLLTSLIFGVVPAWQGSRVDTQAALREGSRGATRQPIRSGLVAVQVGLCVLLLLGGIAFGRAMRHALTLNLGFDTAHTTLATVNPARARYTRARMGDVERRIEDALTREPWVEAAGWMSILPLRGSMSWELGFPGVALKDPQYVDANVVSNGYFDAMGLPLLTGRTFTEADAATSPLVVVVSESMARKYWPTGSALGRRVATDGDGKDPKMGATVIGVVGDARRKIDGSPAPKFYVPLAQHVDELDSSQTVVVRSRQNPTLTGPALVDLVKRVEPGLPLGAPQTMSDHLGVLLMPQRLGLTLFMLFAALATVLTTLGIYAVVAFAVSQRMREIGIRIALGADRGRVLGLVVRQGLRPVGIGAILGAVAFLLAGSALRSLIFSLPAITLPSVAAVAVALGLLTLGAMLVPARRALAVDPAVALRNE